MLTMQPLIGEEKQFVEFTDETDELGWQETFQLILDMKTTWESELKRLNKEISPKADHRSHLSVWFRTEHRSLLVFKKPQFGRNHYLPQPLHVQPLEWSTDSENESDEMFEDLNDPEFPCIMNRESNDDSSDEIQVQTQAKRRRIEFLDDEAGCSEADSCDESIQDDDSLNDFIVQ